MMGDELFLAFAAVPGADLLGSFFGLFVGIARFPAQVPLEKPPEWARGLYPFLAVVVACVPLIIGSSLASRGLKRTGATLDVIWLSVLVVAAANSGLGGLQEFLLRTLLWIWALAYMAIIAGGALIVVVLAAKVVWALVRPFVQSSTEGHPYD